VNWLQTTLEIVKAFSPLITGLAWPILIWLVVRTFRNEIGALFPRLTKFEARGVKIEISELLDNTKALLPKNAIEQATTILREPPSFSVSPKSNLTDRLDALMKLAQTDPRGAIEQSWELLGKTVLQRAKVASQEVDPSSEAIRNAIGRFENDSRVPRETTRSIKNLRLIATKVFNQSQWAYDPSPKEAEDFVLYSAAASTDLNEKAD
jgi:hypothetical protein